MVYAKVVYRVNDRLTVCVDDEIFRHFFMTGHMNVTYPFHRQLVNKCLCVVLVVKPIHIYVVYTSSRRGRNPPPAGRH